MKPTDEELEVVEEIVDDLDYFYEEEEVLSGTHKIRKKLLIRNILIGLLVFLIMTTVIGSVQISIYCDGRETTVVTPSYKDKIVYLETTENMYENLIAFYSINSNNSQTGVLFENIKVVNDGVAINNVNESKSQSFLISYTEKMTNYYENENSFYKLLPKGNEYKELHSSLYSCLDACLNILNSTNGYEIDVSTNSQLLDIFCEERINLLTCWQIANKNLKG